MVVSLKCIFFDFDVRWVVEVNVMNMKFVVFFFFDEYKFVIFFFLDQEINLMGYCIFIQILWLIEICIRESILLFLKY